MKSEEMPRRHLDQRAFREVIGHFASGVTIISTRAEERDFGTTASAVSSLSVDPPMLLICLNKTSETQKAITASGHFVVNILGEDQEEIAGRFATKDPNKFDTVEQRTEHGLPLIPDALAQLECRVTESVTGGTHTVFLAEVESAAASEGTPLTYYRGRFGRFEDALEEAAYRHLRGMVLHRDLPLGAPIRVGPLADDLGMEPRRVAAALTRLAAEHLVSRGSDDKDYRIRPLDVRTADEAIDARCHIEIAVAEAIAGHVGPDDLAELRRHAEAAVRCVDGDPPDLRGLSAAGRSFHETFVALAGNRLLVEFHRRLGIEAIWMRALRHEDGPRHGSPEYLPLLVDACEEGDVARAKQLIRDHTTAVRRLAREAIERAGGEV